VSRRASGVAAKMALRARPCVRMHGADLAVSAQDVSPWQSRGSQSVGVRVSATMVSAHGAAAGGGVGTLFACLAEATVCRPKWQHQQTFPGWRMISLPQIENTSQCLKSVSNEESCH